MAFLQHIVLYTAQEITLKFDTIFYNTHFKIQSSSTMPMGRDMTIYQELSKIYQECLSSKESYW